MATLATLQVPKSHMWLKAPGLDSTDVEPHHHYRKFCWTAVSTKEKE